MTKLITSFLLLGGFLSMAAAQSSCPDMRTVRVEINPDQFWQEISWSLTSYDGQKIWHSERLTFDSLHIRTVCVPADQCILFKIKDDFGDGMTPDGKYTVYLDEKLASIIHSLIRLDLFHR
jgi:hypothetical protein